MTDYNGQGCTIGSSSFYFNNADWSPIKAFDKNESTTWVSNNADTAPWLGIILPEPLYDCTVHIKNRTNTSYPNGPTSGSILGSNDNSTWTNLLNYSNRDGITAGYSNTYSLGNSDEAYKCIRFKIDTWDTSGDVYVAISEFYITGYKEPSTAGWRSVIPYVYKNGVWVEATANVYANSAWKEIT
jgi:hypothetical protein